MAEDFLYRSRPRASKLSDKRVSMNGRFKVITFYAFTEISELGDLVELRIRVSSVMKKFGVVGTVILASEGYNATVAGAAERIDGFIVALEELLNTKLKFKASFADSVPFRKVDVKVKSEIVTLKKPVDVSLGAGTHVPAEEWNDLITDPDVFLLDTRNDYEFRTGTFTGASNPGTDSFSELPKYIEQNLDPAAHKKVAMFCTGGIRCEKFAPYMRSLGFEQVYQLEGGILKYLEVVPPDKQKWEGECFVFDGRRTVDHRLRKGSSPDLSQPTPGDDAE